jgi:hypothetical protein
MRRRTAFFLVLLLIALAVGVYFRLVASHNVVTVDELLTSREAYLDQYVEAQGVISRMGNSACTGGTLLISPTNVNRHIELKAPSSINVDKIDGPAVVWGRIIQAPDRCGFNRLFFEVQAIEPSTSIPTL